MKRMTAMLLLVTCIFLLFGCGKNKEETALRLYLPDMSADEELITEVIIEKDFHGRSTAGGFLDELLPLMGLGEMYRYTRDGDAIWIDLPADDEDRSGIDRALIQSCIVLTLLQVEGVERVGVTEEGAPYVGTKHVLLTEKDMLFAGAEEAPREMTVELYFPRLSGRGLGVEVRQLTLSEDAELYTTVTQALLAGPESSGLFALFPEELELLDAHVEDGICYVNFSVALLDGGMENPAEQDLLLYSIVDTLGNLDTVRAVQVLVEGEVLKSFGTTDTSLPLEPDFALLT